MNGSTPEMAHRITITIETDQRVIQSEFNPGPVPIGLLTVTLRNACAKAISATGVDQWEAESE